MSTLNVVYYLALILEWILFSFKSCPNIREIQNPNFLESQTESSEIKASSEEDTKCFADGGSYIYSVDDFSRDTK